MYFLATPASGTPAAQPGFFEQYGLLLMMVVLLGFMFWTSRRRMKKMKAEQESRAVKMVPGVKVLLQGGLYGTLVEYDADDLSKSARVELAPGMVIEVHSQALLRVVEPEETIVPGDDLIEDSVADETPVVDNGVAKDDAPGRPNDADETPKA